MASSLKFFGVFTLPCWLLWFCALPVGAQPGIATAKAKPVGVQGSVGCLANPKKVDRLRT